MNTCGADKRATEIARKRPRNPLAFVLLTHDKPYQLRRLVSRLNRSFERPLIVCHHDFAQTPLDESSTPGVRFVRPYAATAWGDWSAVDAAISAFREVARAADWEWVVFLSGSDYPIKPAWLIEKTLVDGPFDVYVDAAPVAPEIANEFRNEGLRRYYFRGGAAPADAQRHPFVDGRTCYWGEFWHIMNRRALTLLLEAVRRETEVATWYRRCPHPDESYFHVLLRSTGGLRFAPSGLRYIDWPRDAPHPRTLTSADLPALLESDDLFARKFDERVDRRVLDALDAVIDAAEEKRPTERAR